MVSTGFVLLYRRKDMDINTSDPGDNGRRGVDRGLSDRREYGVARTLIGTLLFIKLYRAAGVLKFLKAIKILGPLMMVVSGIFTGEIYSLIMKTSLVAGLLLSLAVHELGHYVATKQRGLRASWWLFIPFVGAWMEAPDFRSRYDEAYIAFGGPFIGGIFSLTLFSAWSVLPLSNEWGNVLFTTAFLSTMLNLFNMIPLSPLDGGRITEGLSVWFRIAGFIFLIVLSLYTAEASMLLVWMLVLSEIRMSALLRYGVSIVLLILMAVLIMLGYHGSSVLEDWCYFAVGVWLLSTFYKRWKHPSLKYDYRRTVLTHRERGHWKLLYCGLLISLIVLFAAFFPHMNRLVL